MSNQIFRRRPPIFSIVGKMTKNGAGWILVEGTNGVETHVVTQRDAQGNPTTNEVQYLPFAALMAFAKNRDFLRKIVPGEAMRFDVEVSVTWDDRFKKNVPRYWLVDVSPIKEGDSVFESVVKVLGEQNSAPSSNSVPPTVPPAPAPAEPIPPNPARSPKPPEGDELEPAVNARPRPTRSSRYIK